MTIRSLSEHDTEEICRIDERLGGRGQPDEWEQRITFAIRRDPDNSFVAERDGKIAGFVLTDVRGHEFGFTETTGWIEVLAVHPDHQRCDVATTLGEAVLERFRRLQVRCVRTLVSPGQESLKKFFETLGFEVEPLQVLRKVL